MGLMPMMASGKLGAEAPPRSPVSPTELKMMRVVDPVPPLAKIPTVRSGSRALLIMPETMLFTIVVVPELAWATTIPAAERPKPLVETTPRMKFLDTVAFVTSSPANDDEEDTEVSPSAIPTGVVVVKVERPTIRFSEIWTPSSNLTNTPPLLRLSGGWASMLFWVTTVPVFLLAAPAPAEYTPYWTRLMRQFWTRLLLLPVPLLVRLMVVPPKPAPNKVWLLSFPLSTAFFTVTFVTGSPPEVVCPQITALAALVLRLTSVRSRVVPPAWFDPSIVT